MERSGLTSEDVQLRLAILLFQEEMLTLGQAIEITGMHPIMFQKELAKRKIPIHYGIEEFERDWETIKSIK